MAADDSPQGVYVDVPSLLALRHKVALIPGANQVTAIHTMTGSHSSRQRGRGLNFEELRHYSRGDDIRHLDWKTTRRIRKPVIRAYSEEKEQDSIVLVDQRVGMFFGSSRVMKSVIAAELAALLSWASLDQGDRVGLMIVKDDGCDDFRPRRDRQYLVGMLGQLCEANRRLDAGSSANAGQLNASLRQLLNLAGHDKRLWIISDFQGMDATTLAMMAELSRHNSLSLALVYDELELNLPDRGTLSITDGRDKLQVDASSEPLRRRYRADFQACLQQLQSHVETYHNLLLPLNTQLPLERQLGSVFRVANAASR